MFKLLQHAQVRKYIFNTGWLAAERVLRFISIAFTAIIIARYLRPEAYGLFNYAVAYVVLFSPITTLGLGDFAIREFISKRYKDGELLGTILAIRLCSALIAVSIITVAALLSDNEHVVKALIILISLSLFFQAVDVFDKYFQTHTKAKYSAISYIVSLAVSTIVKLLMVLYQAPLVYFALAYSSEFVILAIALAYHYRTHFDKFSTLSFNGEFAKALIKEVIPITVSGILATIYLRIDQVMIKDIRGATELGLFSVAVKVSEALYFIPFIIANSLMPSVLRGMKINKATHDLRLQKLFDLLTWTALPCILLVTIFAPLIVKLFGEEYSGADSILIIHAWTALLVFWSVAIYKIYIAEKMTKNITINTALGAIVNVALNLWLIREYGGRGAAVATIAAHFVAVIVVLFFYKKTRRLLIIILNSLNPVGAVKRLSDLTFSKEDDKK